MPTTINGVGTHYYGKKNLRFEPGVCESCGRAGDLQSYETRLWFVVLFVPIIPLGRKQIFDYCPSCRRHRVMNADQWQQTKEEMTREGLERVRANPDDHEAAIDMHARLVGTHQTSEAEEMARMMAERFADNADVQMYLGAWHEHCRNDLAANQCFERAWQIAPERDDARRAMGLTELERGHIDRGMELLDPLLGDAVKDDPGLLIAIASNLQAAGRHEQALDMLTRVADHHPELARQNKSFRQRVRQLEKQLGQTRSILPSRRGRVLLAGAAVVLVFACLAAWVYTVHQRRTVHIVNGLNTPATVHIEGGPTVTVAAYRRKAVSLPDGRYEATIRVDGLPQETVVIDTDATGLASWFTDPRTRVINVGGAAPLFLNHVTYSVGGGPVTGDDYTGRTWLDVEAVDYLFTDPPDEIRTEGVGAEVRTHLEWIKDISAADMMVYALENAVKPAHLHFAETRLRHHPDDFRLLALYHAAALQLNSEDRFHAFLHKGIEQDPILVEFHRIYQEVHGDEDLVDRYDKLVQQHPENPDALYLRGRLETGLSKARSFYRRALALDKQHARTLQAIAYGALAVADYDTAMRMLMRVPEDRREDGFDNLFRQACVGSGNLQALHDAALPTFRKTKDLDAALSLLVVARRQGNSTLANTTIKQVRDSLPDEHKQVADVILVHDAILRGDNRAAETLIRGLPPQWGFTQRAVLLLGQLETPAELYKTTLDTGLGLQVAIEAFAQGNNALARDTVKSIVEQLNKTASPENKLLSQLFDGSSPAAIGTFLDMNGDLETKAAQAVLLAWLYPDQRDTLLALAHKLNLNLGFPYPVLKRSIDKMTAAAETR